MLKIIHMDYSYLRKLPFVRSKEGHFSKPTKKQRVRFLDAEIIDIFKRSQKWISRSLNGLALLEGEFSMLSRREMLPRISS